MTRDEIVAQVKLLLGFREDQTNTIIAQIAIQQNHLEREVEWKIYPSWLQTERADSFTVANEERVQKPSDWIADIEEDGIWVTDILGSEHLLYKSEENKLRLTFKDDDPTIPEAYASSGDYYRLFPTPDIIYALKMRYYQSQPIVSTGSDTNRWMTNAPNCLIGRVGLMLSGAANNPRRDMFSALYQESKQSIERRSFDELTVNRQYAMGENQ